MFVRYRMNSSANVTTMRTDIDKIIRGLATSTGDLSGGCDTANTTFYGTYPTGKYSRVGTTGTSHGTDTYSKIHNDYGDVTHYIRLGYDTTQLANVTLSQSYISETDTLVNSREIYKMKNIGTIVGYFNGSQLIVSDYSSYLYLGYSLQTNDFIARAINLQSGTSLNTSYGTYQWSADAFDPVASTYILSQASGTAGQNGTYNMSTVNNVPSNYIKNPTNQNTFFQVYRPVSANVTPMIYNSKTLPYGIDVVVTSKMLYISSIGNATQIGVFDIGKNGISRLYTNNMLMAGIDVNAEKFGTTMPYTYKFTTNTYGVQSGLTLSSVNPSKKYNSSQQLVVVENPVFINQEDNGNVVSVVYGLYKLPENTYAAHTTYVDGSNVRRLVTNDYSLLTE